MTIHPFTQVRTDLPIGLKPERPILSVVVDTEEEFDWDAPFSRDNKATTSAAGQVLAHEIFDPLGVKPTYVMDQAIVDCDKASEMFAGLQKEGQCDIGAHLHAWLTPPFEEEVNNLNSFQCNLPYDLKYQKILNLRDSIQARFGFDPKVFKAGRYGIGPNSFKILKELGFFVDCSAIPYTSHRAEGGSHFYGLPAGPFWTDAEKDFLCVPLTRGFIGAAAFAGPLVKSIYDRPVWRQMKVPGILSRTHMLQRVTLTPEGVPAEAQKKLLKRQYDRGDRFFSLAYHSSSLAVGNTSYVQNKADLTAFLDNLRGVLAYFKEELGGEFMSLLDIHALGISSTQKKDVGLL